MAVDDSYTKALLHMNGADASTTFTDESGKTWTANGAAKLSTTSPKFGSAAGLFTAATSDYIDTPDSADFAFAGDFTIDFQVNFTSLPALNAQMSLYCQFVDNNHRVFLNYFNNAGSYYWFFISIGGSGTVQGLFAATISTGTWYHIAFVRTGNTFKLFQAGIQQGSDYTSSDSICNVAAPLYIGAYDLTSHYFDGKVDEYRISNIARWTADFTPPISEYVSTVGKIFYNINGTLRQADPRIGFVNIDGTLRQITKVFVNVGGVLKLVAVAST